MDNDNIVVIVRDMPIGTHGVTVPNEDGSYTVFINARDAINQQQEAYEHEISHINNCDFEKQNVQEIEYAAHHLQPAKVPQEPPQKRRRPRLPRKSTAEDWKEVERVIAVHECAAAFKGVNYFDYIFQVMENRKVYSEL